MMELKPITLTKEQVTPYQNPEGRNQTCWDIVPRTLNSQLSIGFNSMKANACNGVGVHDTWDQVFIVTKGSGTLVSGETRIHTPHDVITDEKQRIEYYYLNVYHSAADHA